MTSVYAAVSQYVAGAGERLLLRALPVPCQRHRGQNPGNIRKCRGSPAVGRDSGRVIRGTARSRQSHDKRGPCRRHRRRPPTAGRRKCRSSPRIHHPKLILKCRRNHLGTLPSRQHGRVPKVSVQAVGRRLLTTDHFPEVIRSSRTNSVTGRSGNVRPVGVVFECQPTLERLQASTVWSPWKLGNSGGRDRWKRKWKKHYARKIPPDAGKFRYLTTRRLTSVRGPVPGRLTSGSPRALLHSRLSSLLLREKGPPKGRYRNNARQRK